jgi:hypothetical protein
VIIWCWDPEDYERVVDHMLSARLADLVLSGAWVNLRNTALSYHDTHRRSSNVESWSSRLYRVSH